MADSVDDLILQYAIKNKNYLADIMLKTKKHYYPHDSRLFIEILFDYFSQYKCVPSLNVLQEFLNGNDKLIQKAKQLYEDSKNDLNSGDLPYYINKLKKEYNERYVRERVQDLAHQLNIVDSNVGQSHDLKSINNYIKNTHLEISALKDEQVYAQGTLQESAKERWAQYNAVEANPELAKGIYCGFKELDDITNGFKGSELVLISGPSGSGKSTVMMNMAVNAWLGTNTIDTPDDQLNNSGKNIWFVSIEMPKGMMERRIDACVAGISSDHIRDGKLTTEEKELFKKSLKFQSKYEKKFYISDLGRGVTVNAIEAQYEKLLALFDPDLLVIDYLGIMRANNPTGVDWFEQGSNAADLHEFARIINKPILTASQMKAALRTPNGLKRFAGDPESVARSKMITDNVNINLQIKKDEDFNLSSYLELVIAKNRDGKNGDSIVLCKEFWRQRVCNLAVEYVKEEK